MVARYARQEANMSVIKTYVFPIGSKNIMFRRTSNRYGRKGTFSNNQGYKRVKRDIVSGKFVPIG